MTRGGPDEEWNIRFVPRWQHKLWHTLFGILLPEEIIRQMLFYLPLTPSDVLTLVMYSRHQMALTKEHGVPMNGKGTFRRNLRRVLGCHGTIDILVAWLHRWVPAGYFTSATILYQGEKIYLLELVNQQELRFYISPKVRLNIQTGKIRPPKITKNRPRRRKVRPWKYAVERQRLEELLYDEAS